MPTARKDHPSDDAQNYTVAEWHGMNLQIKKKFPMFAFMRTLNENPIEAIAMILSPSSLEALENLDMDFEDLDDLVGTISKNLGAKNSGN